MLKKLFKYFTLTEKILWCFSISLTVISFIIFDRENYLAFCASLIGVTSLIFNAKGNPFGQFLMIVFSLMYGIISYSYSYYGEMITYLGMTMPMAFFALISWLKHPYKSKKSEVEIARIKKPETVFMWILTAIVTVIFYYVLNYFNTANILPSTLSVTTSFLAVYLTFRRNPHYAVAYACNDIILIVLWTMASKESISYISVVICFAAFLLNDIYGFINWKRIEKSQKS